MNLNYIHDKLNLVLRLAFMRFRLASIKAVILHQVEVYEAGHGFDKPLSKTGPESKKKGGNAHYLNGPKLPHGESKWAKICM